METAVQQVTFLTRESIDKSDLKGKNSVNDGQQRLSCNYKAYINHDDFKCVVLDITVGKFIINNESLKTSQIPVGVLYNKDPEVFNEYLSKHKELQAFNIQTLLVNIRNKFLSYYYTINYAIDLSGEEQVKWFDVLNLAGSRVTDVMVQLTEMLIKDVDFYKDYSEVFYEILRQSELEHLFIQKDTQISIPLAALNPAYEVVVKYGEHSNNFAPFASDTRASIISALEGKIIKKIFAITLDSLRKAINFIDENSLTRPERIDYLTYLTGAFSFNQSPLNDSQKEHLQSWYQNTKFSNLGNNERRQIFTDLITKLKLLND
jgi:hypothetical protein